MSTNSSLARNFVPMSNKYDRVILLVDMDCFYCQVEEKLDPLLKNQPLAVVQYNAWKGGGIIAVNYAARAKGVTRHMRGDEAKEHCPEIKLVKVPNVREKADLSKYREAGKEVANIMQRFTPLLERASVDEAYLDITDAVNNRLKQMNDGTFILQPQELVNTYAVGFPTIGEFVTTITTSFVTNDDNLYRDFKDNDSYAVRQSNIRLLIGASIASEIRSAVKAETLYECSAGIAHNKILAKLACGVNKPNKQTILPLSKILDFFETLPIAKIKGLGAKFGEEVCERLSVRHLGQLLKYTETELQKKFDEKSGTWLYNICRGIDLEAVTPRFYSKSIGCCKKFPGRNSITGLKTLQHWLNELSIEINDRLEKDIYENNRRAKQMVVNFVQELDGEEISSSRSVPLQCYDTEMLAKTSLETIKANTKQFFRSGSGSVLNNPIKFLGISVGKFETISNSQNNIQALFAQQAAKKQKLEIYKDEKQNILPNLTSCNEPGIKNAVKHTPDEKKNQNMNSFFLNALRKEPLKSTKIPGENGNDAGVINRKKTSLYQLETKSTNHIDMEAKPQDKEAKSSGVTSNCSLKQILQTSFFAKELKNNEEVIKKTAAVNIASNKLDVISHPIATRKSEDNDTCCNKLTGLISDMRSEEDEYNLGLENIHKNNDLSTVNKNADKLNVQRSDVASLSDNNFPVNMKRKYNKISDNEHNNADYRSQYAEFAVPEFTPELLQFTNCSKCDAKIPNDPTSIQTHYDHHFAKELSQQQRHEFRDEIRTKLNSSKSPPNNISNNKKSKKIQLLNSSIKKPSNADITKFLKPSSSSNFPISFSCNQNKVSENNEEICDVCKLPIRIENILEHKDFHMAKDMQRKLNQLEVHTVEVVKKSVSEVSRKRLNSSIITSSRQKVTAKHITQFFTPSNM